jgi:L-seryl-tRNA(Ser) seleniumtransferase
VDALLLEGEFQALERRYGRERVLAHLRGALDGARASLGPETDPGDLSSPARWAAQVASALEADDVPSLRPVINATGVVLHTNLGRAPLSDGARAAMARVAQGYSNLEFDLREGVRGSRYDHCADLFVRLSGAEAALVVNNAAGALVLGLNAVAAGRGVVVSRGELVEIGGGFRIPEIMERSGARLVEVGATNRTRLEDFRAAVAKGGVAAILKVHRSNFRMSGFTEEAGLDELVALAHGSGLPVLHDLGSGLFLDPELLGLPPEPRASESLAQGADLVVVSGDKLFGGPQAGIVMGRGDLIAELRANPLCRALRVDKVTLAGLEATARLYLDPPRALREIPTLRMLAEEGASVRERARSVAEALGAAGILGDVIPARGAVGGGTYPDVTLPSWAVALTSEGGATALSARLRTGATPVVGRIEDDRVLLDARTVAPSEVAALISAVTSAMVADS